MNQVSEKEKQDQLKIFLKEIIMGPPSICHRGQVGQQRATASWAPGEAWTHKWRNAM